MGRISKRKKTGRPGISASEPQRYKAGIYARLSSGQDAGKNESLAVQIEIAKKFTEEFNRKKTGERIDVIECYTDLGKTGSNFEREGFRRLLRDIRNREINCVIVKDLSRFGRNYLETGNYIEKIFPFLGVRFISVADGYDTGEAENEKKQMVSEIKNLVNDMYAKDFSKKAKLHLRQKREDGSYVGGPPPYGYKAEQNGRKRVLVPDETAADIVRFIYEKFAETESYAAVAKELSRRKINPPYRYRKTRQVFWASGGESYKGWDKSTVTRILKSETYSGTLVQGKTGITAGNAKKRIRTAKRDWVITRDAQKPLVDEELYGKTAEICRKIEKQGTSPACAAKRESSAENIFDGILYCGICGRKMTVKNGIYYADGETVQHDNRIAEAELAELLLPLLRTEFAVFLNYTKQYEYGRKRMAEAAQKIQIRHRKTDEKIQRICEEESNLYMNYRAGKISREQYALLKKGQEDKLTDLRKQKESQAKERENFCKLSENYLVSVKKLLELRSEKEFGKEMAEEFLSRLYVYPGKRIEVVLKISDNNLTAAGG
ncbi:MAG: recombinase family protein [Lachnospiraceae bacterium]|nr:recombinase family protein [Lachnospiraceae bacterium]